MRKLSYYGPSLIVLLTAAVVLFAGPRAVRQFSFEQTKSRIIQARLNLEDLNLLDQLNQAYRDIATVVEPAVVHVSAQYIDQDAFGFDRMAISTGSGWVYDEEGHVVTNHHVVQNALRIQVQLYNGILREAELIGSDPTTDIAVIKIPSGFLHPAKFSEATDTVHQGDMVFAFGSPFDFRFSMSSGIVSGMGRSVGVIRDETGRRLGYENFIQVDAAINPGNSGGPLTNHRGEVIGMNIAIATGSRGLNTLEEGQFAGIGLAIPLDMILPVVNQLIRAGYVEKGYLGVTVDMVKAEIAQARGLNGSGVLISGVDPTGPANEAGVNVDDVVTHVNGRAVSTVPQLRSIISTMEPGDTATLTIWRYDVADDEAEKLEIEVPLTRLDTLRTIGRIPHDQDRNAIPALGIAQMSTASKKKAEQLGIEHLPGVLIEELIPDSVLSRQITSGSIIVEVMNHKTRSVDEFINVLGEYDLGFRGVRAIAVLPDGQTRTIRLQVE